MESWAILFENEPVDGAPQDRRTLIIQQMGLGRKQDFLRAFEAEMELAINPKDFAIRLAPLNRFMR
jgi:hypothetical protein